MSGTQTKAFCRRNHWLWGLFWLSLWLGAWIGFWCLSKLTPCYWKSRPICMSQERSCSPEILVFCSYADAAHSFRWGENIDFPAASLTLHTLMKTRPKTCWFSGSSDWIQVAMTPHLLWMSFSIIVLREEKAKRGGLVCLRKHSSLTHDTCRITKDYIQLCSINPILIF